jgi:hypothetical protein
LKKSLSGIDVSGPRLLVPEDVRPGIKVSPFYEACGACTASAVFSAFFRT